jgi:hypothetical protein
LHQAAPPGESSRRNFSRTSHTPAIAEGHPQNSTPSLFPLAPHTCRDIATSRQDSKPDASFRWSRLSRRCLRMGVYRPSGAVLKDKFVPSSHGSRHGLYSLYSPGGH